jgi:Ca2+-binding RTX toxin-like protein
MARFFGEDYTSTLTSVTFSPSGAQVQTSSGEGFSYNEFFGVGEPDLVGGDFSIGGAVNVSLPLIGDRELFRARLFGEIGAKFGLRVQAELDPGSIDATLPYALTVAYPTLDPVADANRTVGLFFDQAFAPDADSGFTTSFPSLLFQLDLEARLRALLGAEFGVLGDNTTFTVIDFDAPVTIPIFSLDSDRQTDAGDADPINLLGLDTQTLLDFVPNVEAATNLGGEFAGVRVPLNSFFSSPAGKDAPKEDATPPGDKKPDAEEPPDPEGLDLGSIDILIPNINTVSKAVDGVFVVDPTKELRNGEIVDLDTPDAPRDVFGDLLDPGDRDDLAALTLDLDGLLTYATGGTFPPLEFGVSTPDLEIGPAAFSVDFFYNLLDVELRAALPLVQEFTLTPAIAQKVAFFDPDTGAAKTVQVETVERQLLFDANGVFQSAAVEARLRELATETPQVARDLDLFVDFAAGVPGSFTADVGGVTGRLVVDRPEAAGEPDRGFEALTTLTGPIARSAPIFGQDQNVEIDLTGFAFAYELIDDRGAAPVSEFIPVAFDPTDTVYRFKEVQTLAALSETGFIDDLAALNVVYEGGLTEVVVTSQARPLVDARTGLEFDLSLLLEGLAASADFNASVDVGPVTVGGSIGFELGPLFSERFPLLNLDIIDLYADSFTITDEAATAFLLGGVAPPPDFGDAIVGTPDDDPDLAGTPLDDEIVGLGGADVLSGASGADSLFPGFGGGSNDGGEGEDTLDYSDQRGVIGAIPRITDFQSRLAVDLLPVDPAALGGVAVRIVGAGDAATQTVETPDGATQTFRNIETLRLTDAADVFQTSQLPAGASIDLGVPTRVFMLGGDDRAYLPPEPQRFGPSTTLLLDMGAGDDAVEIVETGEDWTTATLEGGAGVDTLIVYDGFDLVAGVNGSGVTARGFENLVDLGSPSALAGDDGDNELSGGGELRGRGGDDALIGLFGFDNLLIGGPGADVMNGGAGFDTASYAEAPTSVFISYDLTGDGARGFRGEAQGDRLLSVERVIGTAFSDILLGNAGTQTFEGGDGNDRLIGQGGNDSLLGQEGDDLLVRTDEPELVAGAMLFDGGDGVDIAAFSAPEEAIFRTGTVTGNIAFRNVNSRFLQSDEVTTANRTATYNYRAEDNPFLRARIGEGGADGVAQMIAPAIRNDAIITGGSVRALLNYKFNGFAGIDSSWTDLNHNVSFTMRFTRSALDDTSFTPVQYNSSNRVATIDALNGSRDVARQSYGATITSVGSPTGLRASEEVLSTDVLRDVEGLIGTTNDDELFGSSGNDVLFGNGSTAQKTGTETFGGDYIEAGAGDDRLGFGEAQNLQRITRAPGAQAPSGPVVANGVYFEGGGGAILPQNVNFEALLAQLDPEDATVGASRAIVTGLVNRTLIGSDPDVFEIGSFLWGGAGRDTLDLRFDRGLTFRAEANPTQGALVDLDAGSGSAPVNAFTGERTVYGRAEYGAFSGGTPSSANFSSRVTAHTFGVENVIGTDNADVITGDDGANVIEGGGGGDILNGDGGGDVLSYALADAGVRLNVAQIPEERVTVLGLEFVAREKQLAVDNRALSAAEAGEAGGDFAVNFERIVASAFADRIDVDAGDLSTPTFGVYELGDGDDVFMAVGGGVGEVQGQGGADHIEIGGALYLVNAGAGDDVIVAGDGPVFATSRAFTTIDGGEGADVVRFVGTGYTLLETMGATTVLLSQTLPGGETHQFFIRDVEELVFGEEVVRLAAVDPAVDADRTLTILEDARAPFDLGARAPAAEAEDGARYRILSLPEGATIAAPGAAPLAVGSVVDAGTLDALQATAGQNYAAGVVSYALIDPPADEPDAAAIRLVDLPAAPPVPGVSLGVTAPAAPDGAPVTVTITELPSAGSVFYLDPHPELAARGLIHMVPVAVALGDALTPEQASRLHYRAAQDASGPAGALAYVADVGDGLRDLAATSGAETVDPERDGRATQRIALEVLPVDDAPTVRTLLYPMSPGGELEGRVAAFDPEGDAFTLAVEDGPALGTLRFEPDGAYVYVQDVAVDFGGAAFLEDSFTVRATQADGATAAAVPQIIQILNPALKAPIVFDPTRPDVFFDEQGDPIRLGGLPADDEIIGHDGPDRLFGFGGDDMLRGGMGPDRLSLGKGADAVMGDLAELDGDVVEDFDAEDRIVVEGVSIRPGAILARPGSAILEFDADGDGVADSTLMLEGDYAGQSFEVSTEGGDTVLRLAGPGATQLSTAGERFVTTGDAANRVWGDAGDDALIGAGGDDLLAGGAGDDVMLGGDGDDVLIGGGGGDRMTGGAGADVFAIDVGDFAPGVFTADFITDFTSGEDVLELSGFGLSDLSEVTQTALGADLAIDLGAGRFVLLEGLAGPGLAAGDVAFPEPGRSFELIATVATVTLSDGDDRFITTDAGPNRIAAGAGSDFVSAGAGDDWLDGGPGADVLSGGAGMDTLTGGPGADRVIGGADPDVFVFTADEETGFVAEFVQDFTPGEDRVLLIGFAATGPQDFVAAPLGDDLSFQLSPTRFVVFENVSDRAVIDAAIDFA